MGNRKTNVPSVVEPTPDNLLTAVVQLKEIAEVGEMRRGDPLDAKVTFRDLVNGGLADIGAGFGTGAGGGGVGPPTDRNTPGDDSPFLKPPSFDGLVLPGRPANVHTMAVWDGIQVIWDWPDAEGTNTYWKRAVIWASATPDFDRATIVGYSTMNFYTHMGIGLSADIEDVEQQPGVRYYWVAWEGLFNEVTGAPDRSDTNPYKWEDGIRGQTATDPEYALDLLIGEISEFQLSLGLNDRIDLVDFDPDNPGTPFTSSVQERILNASVDESGIYAAIAEVARTSVSDDGFAQGEYSIRIDVNGYVAGYGLSAYSRIDSETGGRETGSAFIISADYFAVTGVRHGAPDFDQPPIGQPFEPQPVFIVKTINGEHAVGIRGELIVDGSITANSIQADSIGAREINAQEIYTDLLSAINVIAGQFSTSVNPNMRLELNGEGSDKELFPFWYGRGTTGGDESVFYADRSGTMKLAGELYVTGAGKFFAGNLDDGEWRIEIGGPSDDFMLWAGTGIKAKNNENYAFWIDNEGEAKFKGKLEAQYVSGEISRTNVVNDYEVFDITSNARQNVQDIVDSEWETVGTWECPAPPFDYGHVPYCSMSFNLYGFGQHAGAARLQFRANRFGAAWRTVTKSAFDIYVYGETKSLIASARRVYGQSDFRLQLAGFDGSGPTSSVRNGIIMGIR